MHTVTGFDRLFAPVQRQSRTHTMDLEAGGKLRPIDQIALNAFKDRALCVRRFISQQYHTVRNVCGCITYHLEGWQVVNELAALQAASQRSSCGSPVREH